jgi:hypothetical protein
MKTVFSPSRTLFPPALLAVLLVAAAPQQQARAQAQVELGPRVGYEIEQLNELSVGADLRASTAALPFQVNGTFDYYFASEEFDASDFDDSDERENAFIGAERVFRFTANALYEAGLDNQYFTPYFGPGLSVTRISYVDESVDVFGDDSTTDLGLNAVGGAEFGLGGLRPFVQAEFVLLGDAEPVQLTAGLLFNVGGS